MVTRFDSFIDYKKATDTTGAAEEAVGDVISQTRNPVTYVSRKSAPVEHNYSNNKHETLTIAFVVTVKAFSLFRMIRSAE